MARARRCFYPTVQGYGVSSVTPRANGLDGVLKLQEDGPFYTAGVPTLALQVDFESASHIHVKIFDPANARCACVREPLLATVSSFAW